MDSLTDVLARVRFGWRDAIDVAIVGFLVYQVLLLLRGTRAAQMLLSGAFIGGLFLLSRWMELESVNWLIRNVAPYASFAVIVLFQAEIRRALAHFGRAPFIQYFEARQSSETIDELVEAAAALATRRTGAIIVVEREIGLRNYIEGGIPLDATVTCDLVSSIFQPGSPLHDGAVIIQDDRLAAAACFLPLSTNPTATSGLGTRHRAALGLTEENDAVAIVVSEETGAIALVLSGSMERPLSPERLRARLHELLSRRRHRPDRIPVPQKAGA